jgi:hypothetical protein
VGAPGPDPAGPTPGAEVHRACSGDPPERLIGVAAAATILDQKISGSSDIRVGESSGGQDHP